MKQRSGPPTPMVKSLGDRQGFFDGGRVASGRDFGFSGSLQQRSNPTRSTPPVVAPPTVGPKSVPEPVEVPGGAFARGGKVRLPGKMKPAIAKQHSPINTPPRNPNITVTPRNTMPGGQMAYGVQPSAEPDRAGTTQGIRQLRGGGRVRLGADRGSFE